MKYARTTLPGIPPGGVTAGVDWARDDHAVAVVDAAGRVAGRFAVEHTAAGLKDLVRRLRAAGPRRWRSSVPTARSLMPCWKRA